MISCLTLYQQQCGSFFMCFTEMSPTLFINSLLIPNTTNGHCSSWWTSMPPLTLSINSYSWKLFSGFLVITSSSSPSFILPSLKMPRFVYSVDISSLQVLPLGSALFIPHLSLGDFNFVHSWKYSLCSNDLHSYISFPNLLWELQH